MQEQQSDLLADVSDNPDTERKKQKSQSADWPKF
jgi:hypothetical protein